VNAAESPNDWLLVARHISKAFPGVQALSEVDLALRPGEVLGVVGENGAGKSTLMKILGGVTRPDSGEIQLDGKPVQISSVHEAQTLGITLIHQELNLAVNLDIAANLFLGREPTWGGPLGLLSRSVYDDAARIIRRLGLACSPRTLVSQLSVGQQQLVEIARALSLRSRVLIMDEPTSSLTQRETERLYQVIRGLKQDGVSVLYISHRLREVEEITDRVLVLRDGRNAGELQKDEIRHEALVRLMVGRELRQFFQRQTRSLPNLRASAVDGLAAGADAGSVGYDRPVSPGAQSAGSGDSPPLLHVANLTIAGPWPNAPPIDFEIQSGEIVGMAGLMGAGRTELAEALFGIRAILGGQVLLDGKALQLRSPREAIAAGVFLVPEDRRVQGLVLAASVRHNISLGSLERLSWLRIVSLKREQDLAGQICCQLNVRTPDTRQTVGLLSGGNQQKVVLGKWLGRTPRLLILDEPTRGVDVGAKSEIYAIMDQLASQGVGILMISSGLEEILGMSDRVLVMHEGRLAGQLPREKTTEEGIMRLATGGGSAECGARSAE
jgi:ribose transport system ATP-binding protein